MSLTTDHWAERTVKDGAVVICGKVFRPTEYYQVRDGLPCNYPYDGRLEGMRLLFGRYIGYEGNVPCHENFVYMWGDRNADNGNVSIQEDGCLPWLFWITEDQWQKDKPAYETFEKTERRKAELER